MNAEQYKLVATARQVAESKTDPFERKDLLEKVAAMEQIFDEALHLERQVNEVKILRGTLSFFRFALWLLIGALICIVAWRIGFG